VPITFQTTAVLLIGLTYARFSTSFMAVGSYLALGALGLPVFNGYSAGFAYMSGPTFGYLLGFLIAISVMYGAKRVVTLKSQAVKNTLLCLFGLASIYLCGLLWLSHLFGFEKALSVGFMPFIGPELLKSVTLVGLVRLIRN
jgi:biotin transport system substrate-specific component